MRPPRNLPLLAQQMKTRKAKAVESGFTLLETVVAMAIMTMAVIALANAWSGNVVRVKNARVNNTVAMLLERKMTEFEIEFKDKAVSEIPEEEAGDFGTEFPGYRWTMASKEFEMPDMSSSLIAREGGADELLLTMVRTTTEHIRKVVKEVSVSVYFKGKRGPEVKHTVGTYFIDFTKEPELPNVPGLGGGQGGQGAGAGQGTGQSGGQGTGGQGGSAAGDGGN